jgi:hypothetical protein
MKPNTPLTPAVQFFTAAIVVLGFLGGCLIVAYSGYSTSPKRGGIPVFVPAPEAYLLAATMFGMSVIGLVALLRARRLSMASVAFAVVVYIAIALAFMGYLSPP